MGTKYEVRDDGTIVAEAIDLSGSTSETIISFKMYQQSAQPSLAADGDMAIWWDTDDNKLYIIARNNGTTKAVELT